MTALNVQFTDIHSNNNTTRFAFIVSNDCDFFETKSGVIKLDNATAQQIYFIYSDWTCPFYQALEVQLQDFLSSYYDDASNPPLKCTDLVCFEV